MRYYWSAPLRPWRSPARRRSATAQAQDDKDKGPAAEGKKSPRRQVPQSDQARAGASTQRSSPHRNRAEPAQDRRPQGRQRESEPRSSPRPRSSPQGQAEVDPAQARAGKEQPRPRSSRRHGPAEVHRAEAEPGKDQPKATEQPQPGKDASLPSRVRTKSRQGPQQAGAGQEQQRTSVRERLVKETPRREDQDQRDRSTSGAPFRAQCACTRCPSPSSPLPRPIAATATCVLEDETIVHRRSAHLCHRRCDLRRLAARRRDAGASPLSADDMRFIFTSRAQGPQGRRARAAGAGRRGAAQTSSCWRSRASWSSASRRCSATATSSPADDIVIVDPSDYSVVLVINE